MGTNYYHRRDVCPTCQRAAEEVHIGKSSMGWTFSFSGTAGYRTWEEWRDVLRSGGEIRDEYGDAVTLAHLERLVEEKRGGKNHAATYGDGWVDPDGHSFSSREFS
jgi:hypothetical protein